MYAKVLVPVSFEEERDVEKSLKVATLLAGETGEVTLIHVVEHVPAYAMNYVPAEFIQDARRTIETDLAKMTSKVRRARSVVLEGSPGHSLLEWSENNGIDCIVIASHRPGLQDYFLGSTAARVVRHARCAVHVVR